MPGFDVKQIKRNDQVILGAGILFLLLSFFAPFYGYTGPTIRGFGGLSVTAWHSYGFLGVLLIIIAVGIVAARVFGNASLPTLPVGPNLLVAGLATLGSCCFFSAGSRIRAAGLSASNGAPGCSSSSRSQWSSAPSSTSRNRARRWPGIRPR